MQNKNNTNVATTSSPIGFLTLLGLLFIGLKLTGYISWSWWFVLMPLYLAPALFVGVAGAAALVIGIGALIGNRK